MDRPNILFLMTDQHRTDHLGYCANAKMATPNIDRIAEAAAFTRCNTVNPVCTPARTALLTGKYTHQIGMLQMSGDLSLSYPTYLQALQRAGYYTGGVGKFHFWQGWKWNQPADGLGHPLSRASEEIRKYGFDYEWEVSGKQLAVQNHCRYCDHLEEKGILKDYRRPSKN